MLTLGNVSSFKFLLIYMAVFDLSYRLNPRLRGRKAHSSRVEWAVDKWPLPCLGRYLDRCLEWYLGLYLGLYLEGCLRGYLGG